VILFVIKTNTKILKTILIAKAQQNQKMLLLIDQPFVKKRTGHENKLSTNQNKSILRHNVSSK
jgi:hypothetical protein